MSTAYTKRGPEATGGECRLSEGGPGNQKSLRDRS